MDGDLDIAVNNLRGPAQIFENRLCTGDSLQVELVDPASQNRHAIGARLELVTSVGAFTRDVRAASGYLSGDPPRVHFGFPADAVLERLEITWPDGARSTVIAPDPNHLLRVERLRIDRRLQSRPTLSRKCNPISPSDRSALCFAPMQNAMIGPCKTRPC